MNHKLDNALANLIIDASKGVKDSIGFIQAELPDVVQQLLLWKKVDYLIGMFIALLFLYVAYKCKQKLGALIKNGKDDDLRILGYGTCLTITAPVSIMAFLLNLFSLVKITLAPKVWLIEYAGKLIK